MKFEYTEVWGFKHAIRGMRNSFDSWDKSDSSFTEEIKLGEEDINLMRKLVKAGSSHRKFMRQIMVSVDISAPLYWWKQFDTYKVGTVANSCSTMHTITRNKLSRDNFEVDGMTEESLSLLDNIIEYINGLIDGNRNETFRQIIKLLPDSYIQKRTVTMSYENVLSMVEQRTGHKLKEWGNLVGLMGWAYKLPYFKDITCNE